MGRTATLFGMVLLMAVLQGTMLHGIAPGGVTVDGVLLITLCAGLAAGPSLGAGLGFFGGIMMGAAAGNLAGPLAMAYVAVGWAGGALQQRGLADHALVAVASGSVATGGLIAFEYFALHLLSPPVSYTVPLNAASLLVAYHSVLLLPVLVLVRWVLRARRSYSLHVWRGRRSAGSASYPGVGGQVL